MEARHPRNDPAGRSQPGPGSIHQLRPGHQTLFRDLFLFGELTANETGRIKMKTFPNTVLHSPFTRAALILYSAFCILHSALGYPPAPTHTLYGLVRDQYGTPF